ncbi:hypothetical protein [Streptomyces sp. E1N211]|uniref:hypothetical protein n=1 Tax=Streptomyces sp. E1N211 TaxID=1851876 RepID=UPI001F4E80B5|nr:hypothetical protein [Streptomyces sp. E1N211]
MYPSSVAPGAQVSANTAACGEEGTSAGDASAVGAGRFTLAPSTHEGEAIGQFQVPPSAQPGTYEIVVACAGSGPGVRGGGEKPRGGHGECGAGRAGQQPGGTSHRCSLGLTEATRPAAPPCAAVDRVPAPPR